MFNRVIFIGRLTADPELRQTPSGVSVTNFSIAVNRTYASRTGERQTDFFDIVCWRNQAEFVTKFFKKGNAIGVEGRMETRDYTDKSGNKRRAYELIADNVFFVESKASAASSSQGSSFEAPAAPFNPAPGNAAPVPAVGNAFSSGKFDDFAEIDNDDDLPF